MSGSRYWHNYRHGANALSLYSVVKAGGIADDRIVLLMAESYACDPRNPHPATVFNDRSRYLNLHSCATEIDAVGYEVSTSAACEVLQGRYGPSTPPSRILRSTDTSNVVVYLTGHGNRGFIKLHDTQYLTSMDLADSIDIMRSRHMFRKMLVIADTCNAESMCLEIRTPNVVCIGSSTVDANSYSHHGDDETGIEVIDTFAYELVQQLQRNPQALDTPLSEIISNLGRTRAAMRTAVNDPNALHTWTLREFFTQKESQKEVFSLIHVE